MGHSCIATVARSVSNCGSFASSESPNKKTGGLLEWLKAGFPFWLGSFGGDVSVKIIRCCPATCGDTFHRFCERMAIPHHALFQIATVPRRLHGISFGNGRVENKVSDNTLFLVFYAYLCSQELCK